MKLFRWEEGRQRSGYFKMLLAQSKRFKFDCYLLKYVKGSIISLHNDPVDEGEHHRINIIVKKPKRGGHFWCEEGGNNDSRFIYFRPDIHDHCVSEITEGSRYVLSIGWIKNVV